MNKSFALTLLVFILAFSVVTAQTDLPTFDDLDEGWTMLSPGGDTICSNGTEYAFFVRPADPTKLVFYLQGGGACWFGHICDLQAEPTYDPFVDEGDSPQPGGIFDLENPENPFADYSMVFVPYCTADVHLGGTEATYQSGEGDDAREFTIHHNGFTNVSAVLDWTFANFESPEAIFVSGSSAGSIPSPLYGGLIVENYPNAQIAVLGDGAGGYRSETIPAIMAEWGTASILPDWEEYEGIEAENLSFEHLYIASATRFPDVAFAQYNTAHDETQYFFLSLVGVADTPLPDLLEGAFTEIGDAADNFNFYTAGGTVHTIMGRPQFYAYQVHGLRFVDWVAAFAAGEAVEDVVCSECDEAEVAEGD